MNREIRPDAVPRAVVEIEPRSPQRGARQGVDLRAARSDGKTARAIAMWPLSTRVNRSRMSALGCPTAIVRVMSVVPSSYCPPLSMRKMPRAILRLDASLTR